MSARESEYVQIEDARYRTWFDNSVAMRDFNRAISMRRYYGLEATPVPVEPLLHKSGSPEPFAYAPPMPQAMQSNQSAYPIGDGPDRFGFYDVVEPDYHNIGELLQTHDGSVWCRIEMPTIDSGFTGKWCKVS